MLEHFERDLQPCPGDLRAGRVIPQGRSITGTEAFNEPTSTIQHSGEGTLVFPGPAKQLRDDSLRY